LSLSTEVYRRGPHADQLSPYRPWTAEERAGAEVKIRHLYDMFVGVVAEGRKSRGLTRDKVNEVGRGHIWTGGQARQQGLVDEFGGLAAAIDRASTVAGLPVRSGDRPELVILPRPDSSLLRTLVGARGEEIVRGGAAGARSHSPGVSSGSTGDAAAGGTMLGAMRGAMRLLGPVVFGPGEGIEARMPVDIDTR
ncbi:MAG: S49 family peptidase, partial [Pseudomonadota bacterium]